MSLFEELLFSAVILVVSFIVAFAVWSALKYYTSRIAVKTGTRIDDIVVSVVRFPLFISIVLVGVNVAVRRLGILGEYLRIFDMFFYGLWTVIGGYVVYTLFDFIVPELSRRAEIPRTPSEVIRKVLKWITVVATIVALFSIAGIEMGGVISVIMLVLGTLIFLAFASWSIMGNIVAGIVLMTWRPLEVGDYIELSPDAISGRVEDVSLMFTKLKLKTGEEMNIPNTLLMQKYIRNLSRSGPYLIKLTYKASSKKKPKDVESRLLDIAGKTEGVLNNPAPFVTVKNIEDNTVTYELNVYTDKAYMADEVESRLRENILKYMA